MSIRILVVDDASFIRDMMKKHLREKIAGAQIFDAVDGNRAIAALKANTCDLILSDWEMPGMSGEEFLRWVRAEEQYKSIPFVMVSSRGDRDHIMQAIQAGVSDYLTKPFTPEELIRKAVKQLEKIGKNPNVKFGTKAAANQGHAFGSIEALTGGEDRVVAKPAAKPAKPEAAGILNAPKPKTAAAPTADSKSKAQAQLRFPNSTYACEVKDLSLQALNGVIKRDDSLPALFDQAVVDIATEGGEDLARINGYVHSLQGVDNHVNTENVKVIVRFVDDDPAKFEILSKFIAKFK